LWFCEKQYNFCFFQEKDFNFCGFVKTTKRVFFRSFTLYFDFCVFVKINNNAVFFPYITFHFLWFCAKQCKLCFFHVFVFIFCGIEKTKKVCFFHVIHFNSVFSFFFFMDILATELVPRIRFKFFWSFEKLYEICFFHVLDFNFCGFEKTTRDCFFTCITLQFDFSVVVLKIYDKGDIFTY
jgi:hypothetical protein